ncbi:MAG TPA: hypothetical protein VGF08_09055 [Terriglobales bacterium]|jgi:hypothetical protein
MESARLREGRIGARLIVAVMLSLVMVQSVHHCALSAPNLSGGAQFETAAQPSVTCLACMLTQPASIALPAQALSVLFIHAEVTSLANARLPVTLQVFQLYVRPPPTY